MSKQISLGRQSMGPVLRMLNGDPVVVTLQQEDFNVVNVRDSDGKEMAAPAKTLLAFNAVAYREVRDPTLSDEDPGTDIWEFRVQEESKAGPVPALLFVRGRDILLIKTIAKIR